MIGKIATILFSIFGFGIALSVAISLIASVITDFKDRKKDGIKDKNILVFDIMWLILGIMLLLIIVVIILKIFMP